MAARKKITWKLEKRKLSELREWPDNPRFMTEDQANDLANSINRFGFAEPIIINTDNMIIGGHMRKKILITKMGISLNTEVPVMVPSRKLTEDEMVEFAIRLNKNTGSFDFDKLANDFDNEELFSWGFTPKDFGFGEDNDEDTKGGKKEEEEGVCPKCKRPL
jgi:ParB-like chromosome segregation protein Spo0J